MKPINKLKNFINNYIVKIIESFFLFFILIILNSCITSMQEVKNAESYRSISNYEMAVKNLQVALLKKPDNKKLNELLNATKHEAATHYINKARNYISNSNTTVQDFLKTLSIIEKALEFEPNNKLYLSFKDDIDNRLQKLKNEISVLTIQSENYAKNNEYNQAIYSIKSAINKDPKNNNLINKKANIYQVASSFYYEIANKELINKIWDKAFNAIIKAEQYQNSNTVKIKKEEIINSAIVYYLSQADNYIKNKQWKLALLELNNTDQFKSSDKTVNDKKEYIKNQAVNYHLTKAEKLMLSKNWNEADIQIKKAEYFKINSKTDSIKNELYNKWQSELVVKANDYASKRMWNLCFIKLDNALRIKESQYIVDLKLKYKNQKKALSLLNQSSYLIKNNKYITAYPLLKNAYKLYPDNDAIYKKLIYVFDLLLLQKEKKGYYYEAISLIDDILQLKIDYNKNRLYKQKKQILKNSLKDYYVKAIQISEKSKQYGDALLYVRLIGDMGFTIFNNEESRLMNNLREKANQEIAILPFNNIAYGLNGKNYGALISNKLRITLQRKKELCKYLNFVNRDQIDLIAREYQYSREKLMRRTDQNMKGGIIAADYLLVGTVNKFDIEKPYPEKEQKTVKYQSGTHKESNSKWYKWKDCKKNYDYCYSECYNNTKGGLGNALLCATACSCGDEPQQYFIIPDYDYHNYYKETHTIKGEVELSWKLIDMRTTREVLQGTAIFDDYDSDVYVEGFSRGGIEYDPLELKTPEKIEEILLKGVIDKVLKNLGRFLEDMPANLYSTAYQLDNMNIKNQAREAYMEAYAMKPNNDKYIKKMNKIKESLKIHQLNQASYVKLQNKYKSDIPDAISQYNETKQIKNNTEKELFSSITKQIIEEHYDLARTLIKHFIEKYPNSSLIDQVIEMSNQISGK